MSLVALGTLGVLSGMIPGLSRMLQSSQTTSEVLEKATECAQNLSGHTDPEKILEAFQKHPHILSAFYGELAKLEASAVNDRKDARQRDALILKSTGHNRRADVMVVAAAIGLLGCLLALAFYKEHLPGEAVGIISTIAGIFGSCLKDAYAFEFGSSRGSKTKDEHVAAALRIKQ